MILLHKRSEKSVCPPMEESDKTKMKGNRPSLHHERLKRHVEIRKAGQYRRLARALGYEKARVEGKQRMYGCDDLREKAYGQYNIAIVTPVTCEISKKQFTNRSIEAIL